MNRLLLKPADCDVETERLAGALASRGAETYALRLDHPAGLIVDILKLRKRARDFNLLHAFGARALSAALGAGSGRIIFSPIGFPTSRLAMWLRAISAYRTIDVICSSDTARRFLVTRGVPIERCRLIRPGVQLSSIPTARDRALRARLGYDDSHTVLLIPLEITHASGHAVAMWAASILHIIQPQYRLLLWGRGPARAMIDHVRERLIDPKILTIATDVAPDIEIESLFSAADTILMTPDAPVPPLMVAMAMASSRPIIAVAAPQLCELLEDRRTALLLKELSPRLVAQRIMDLQSDAPLSRQIQDRARAEAYNYLTRARMLESFDALYAEERGANHEADSPTLAKPSEA